MIGPISKYFSSAELRCKHCGLTEFHPYFLERLYTLRETFGKPMNPTSCCRCAVYNAAVKGKPGSFHIGDTPQHEGQLGCLAIDITTPDGFYRGELFTFAWKQGWSIGWNAKRSFLHLDMRILIGFGQISFDY